MEKVNLSLEHCYGIKKLEYTVDFSVSNKCAIYAPNGIMKSSLAKVFRDIIDGKESIDVMFPKRNTTRIITDEKSVELSPKQIFVIDPYENESYESEKVSTLLVNKKLKNQYDSINLDIDKKKDILLKALKPHIGLRIKIDEEISDSFFHRTDKFFEALGRIEKEILDGIEPEFIGIDYKEIFNEKVKDFLTQKDIISDLKDYLEKYEELLENSQFFQKGVFNHNNASVIAKNLKANGFFKAHHTVFLNSQEKNKEIKTEAELIKVIEQEKESILVDEELQKRFNIIDEKIGGNAALRGFREFLSNNIQILPELANLESFRQNLWISYLKEHKDLFIETINSHNASKSILNKIIDQANRERTQWESVVDEFNKRFSVPFQVKISNQVDVILSRVRPTITFSFIDNDDKTEVTKDDLLNVLSSGERRALYLLNIIFEVEARKSDNQETLFIIDDIADSFDYKNKYAIIEYLIDIGKDDRFHQIVLTHNFDFFRTIQSRFISYENCFMVEKTLEEIKIINADYIKNPFIYWIRHWNTNKIQMIATIPFVRNIIEYTQNTDDPNYKILTSLLHILPDSRNITVEDLQKIYHNIFSNHQLDFENKEKYIIDLILELADECVESSESANLENKILLSIAIRLSAELFMIDKINDSSKTTGIEENQTSTLLNMFKSITSDNGEIDILEQVKLMTPENIHFNSFMYEPILDMSDAHLKKLYQDVKSLN